MARKQECPWSGVWRFWQFVGIELRVKESSSRELEGVQSLEIHAARATEAQLAIGTWRMDLLFRGVNLRIKRLTRENEENVLS